MFLALPSKHFENGHPSTMAAATDFSLIRDDWGRLVLTTADGVRAEDVKPVRLFPFSDPEHWISLVGAGSRELLCFENPRELPEEVQELIFGELARREFVPIIQKIHGISAGSAPSEWDVETDRGRVRFLLSSDDDIRSLDEDRALIQDSHGTRYLLASLRGLDGASQRRLSRYL